MKVKTMLSNVSAFVSSLPPKVLKASDNYTFYSFSLKMSTVSAACLEAPAVTEAPEQKKPLKACCACPETKQVRDAW